MTDDGFIHDRERAEAYEAWMDAGCPEQVDEDRPTPSDLAMDEREALMELHGEDEDRVRAEIIAADPDRYLDQFED